MLRVACRRSLPPPAALQWRCGLGLSASHRGLSSVVVSRKKPRPEALELAEDEEAGTVQSFSRASAVHGALRQITMALAPADQAAVELPERQLRDLDQLYDSLISPLASMPTQAEKVDKRRRVVQAVDADAFFSMSGQDRSDPQSHAHRIRCLGAQGHVALAHAAFEHMRDVDGVVPDPACYAALADACARAGDVEGVEGVIALVKRAGMPTTAPLYTSLLGAHRRAGSAAVTDVVDEVLGELRRSGVVEDIPLHTSIICWLLQAKRPDEAWDAYHALRSEVGLMPDAVTYTAMMVACAQADQLEHAQALLREMRKSMVVPTLATHNAFIAVCAARASSLRGLPRERRQQLQRLNVDLDVSSPVRLATLQYEALLAEGHAADPHTYLSLLKVAEGAADVPRAQSVLTRMLDSDVSPSHAHFHALLRTVVRSQRYAPEEKREAYLAVAMAAPPSLAALGLGVQVETIDLVLHAHITARRVHDAIDVLDQLYAANGVGTQGTHGAQDRAHQRVEGAQDRAHQRVEKAQDRAHQRVEGAQDRAHQRVDSSPTPCSRARGSHPVVCACVCACMCACVRVGARMCAAPRKKSFDLLLRLAEQQRMPRLAADVLDRARAANVIDELTDAQRELPQTLAVPRQRVDHPLLPPISWSPLRGFFRPRLSPETEARWRRVEMPREGGAERPAVGEGSTSAYAQLAAAAAAADASAASSPAEEAPGHGGYQRRYAGNDAASEGDSSKDAEDYAEGEGEYYEDEEYYVDEENGEREYYEDEEYYVEEEGYYYSDDAGGPGGSPHARAPPTGAAFMDGSSSPAPSRQGGAAARDSSRAIKTGVPADER